MKTNQLYGHSLIVTYPLKPGAALMLPYRRLAGEGWKRWEFHSLIVLARLDAGRLPV